MPHEKTMPHVNQVTVTIMRAEDSTVKVTFDPDDDDDCRLCSDGSVDCRPPYCGDADFEMEHGMVLHLEAVIEDEELVRLAFVRVETLH